MKTFGVGWVLETLAAQEGLNVVAENIDDVCFGMVIAADKTFIQVAREASGVYNYQIVDGNPIRLVRRQVNDSLIVDYDLNETDCVRRGGAPAVALSRVDPASLPRQVEIQHIDPARDYAVTTQVARHTAAPRTNSQISVGIDFIVSAQQARDMAFDLLYRLWAQQLAINFEHTDLTIEPGDTVRMTTGRGVFVCLVANSVIKFPARTNTITATILLTSKATTSIVAAPEADIFGNLALTGVAATAAVGTLTVSVPTGVSASVTGVSSTSHAGAAAVAGRASASITGVAATSAVGTATVTVAGGPTTNTFTTPGAGTDTVPGGCTTLVGESWGAGGSGSGGFSSNSSGAGGGGYSKFTISVSPGQTIYYTVGAGGAGTTGNGANGGDSWVNPSSNAAPSSNGCIGGGGGGAGASTPGAGGAGTIGTTNHSGGNGVTSGSSIGGGGGGGAGSSANGSVASGSTHGAGGSPDGGNGSDGVVGAAIHSADGSAIGGASGGSWNSVSGTGGRGQVRLAYT